MVKLILILLFIGHNYGKILNPISLDIKITSLKQCDTKIYPVKVDNVAVKLLQGKLIVSGTLSTSVDLISPIKAEVEVERDELGMWIEVPCVSEIGSCTYNNLCTHGVSVNSTCPPSFIDNNVPCRCPIPKGTYTIQPSIELQYEMNELSSIYSGNYWAKAILSQENYNSLACYEVYFEITDQNVYTGNDNDIIPFVELV